MGKVKERGGGGRKGVWAIPLMIDCDTLLYTIMFYGDAHSVASLAAVHIVSCCFEEI